MKIRTLYLAELGLREQQAQVQGRRVGVGSRFCYCPEMGSCRVTQVNRVCVPIVLLKPSSAGLTGVCRHAQRDSGILKCAQLFQNLFPTSLPSSAQPLCPTLFITCV